MSPIVLLYAYALGGEVWMSRRNLTHKPTVVRD